MTEFLKKLSLFLLIFPAVTMLYDLVDGWFVHNVIALDKLSKWWTKVGLSPTSLAMCKQFMSSVINPTTVEKIFNAPAGFVLFVPPIFFYLVYRIIFAIQGGKKGGYKSRY